MSRSGSSRYSADAGTRRLYGGAWQRARAAYLAKHPLCRMCEQAKQIKAAEVVDHITPHKGDLALFWDSSNWQSLCKACHDGAKQRLEQGKGMIGASVDGMPLDASHHWYS